MATPTTHHHPAIINFFEALNVFRQPGVCGNPLDPSCTFIPRSKLKAYFRDFSNVTSLLRAVFGEDGILPVDPNTIARHYPCVFTILLLIDTPQLIQYFGQYEGLRDEHLPFDANYSLFPASSHTADRVALIHRFRQEQWQFCAHTFGRADFVTLDPHDILPVRIIETLGQGVSAKLLKIEIHGEYNKIHGGSADLVTNYSEPLPPKARNPSSAEQQRRIDRNIFVLKQYHCGDEAKVYYENERSAFRNLNSYTSGRDEPSIIRCHGGYVQGKFHNILLEYANLGTLEDYFRRQPPQTPEEILDLWTKLLDLITALKRIHALEENEILGAMPLRGCHQDIKPSNILVTGDLHTKNWEHPRNLRFLVAD